MWINVSEVSRFDATAPLISISISPRAQAYGEWRANRRVVAQNEKFPTISGEAFEHIVIERGGYCRLGVDHYAEPTTAARRRTRRV
jgi:hypothetical protein